MIKLGVIGSSKKTNERRRPIHPDHFQRIPKELRCQLIFERGYGKPFDISDSEIAALSSGSTMDREQLLSDIGNVIIAKPVLSDLENLRQGGLLWGYPHCTQQRSITQAAIERKLTLISFEEMFVWGPEGQIGRHTFYKNNELAGYSAVLHALELKGIDGHYGKQRKVIILSFGAVSRGAIYALKARGFRDITICIQRPDHEVREEILDCHYVRLQEGKDGEPRLWAFEHDGKSRSFHDLIGEADIIVNGSAQDPDNPYMFITANEISCLKPRSIIIDVSCDEGMGFFFAKPTSFHEPIFKVGNVDYYGVDHTPSYLWESASRSISAALIVYLQTVLQGPDSWQRNETIRRAIAIDKGRVQLKKILSFQKRQAEYPHNPL
uniref:Alanine dehydrogenase n=1 Tax=Candidatus Kentrum sp. LPFa TaxID=2126335 RepID=A0A450X1P3_9GAMM|nr:MAG: Alanine dehydrogenase [Candidatus Kentron sp. LPFa]